MPVILMGRNAPIAEAADDGFSPDRLRAVRTLACVGLRAHLRQQRLDLVERLLSKAPGPAAFTEIEENASLTSAPRRERDQQLSCSHPLLPAEREESDEEDSADIHLLDLVGSGELNIAHLAEIYTAQLRRSPSVGDHKPPRPHEPDGGDVRGSSGFQAGDVVPEKDCFGNPGILAIGLPCQPRPSASTQARLKAS